MGPATMRAVFVVFAAVLTSAGGCVSGDDPLRTGAGVEVEVVRGPIHPVEREGVENVAPVAEAVVSVEPTGGGRARTVSTDRTGSARLELRTGAYRVSVESCPGALLLPRAVEPVRVTPATFTPVRFVCDTGIR